MAWRVLLKCWHGVQGEERISCQDFNLAGQNPLPYSGPVVSGWVNVNKHICLTEMGL